MFSATTLIRWITCDDTEEHGNLDNFSAFPNKSSMKGTRHCVINGDKEAEQIINQTNEKPSAARL